MGFAFKRPKKRLVKGNESKREAIVAQYAALWEEAQRTARIFFADEAHFRADAELRGKWVLKGKPNPWVFKPIVARVVRTSPPRRTRSAGQGRGVGITHTRTCDRRCLSPNPPNEGVREASWKGKKVLL